jgi:CDP-paratose 2-epimerase
MERILNTRWLNSTAYRLQNYFQKTDMILDCVDSPAVNAPHHSSSGSSTKQKWLDREAPGAVHYKLDLRQREGVMELINQVRPSVVIHSVPPLSSKPKAADPLGDWDLMVTGTLNLLEAMRRFCPQNPFVFLSTERVYGDRTNTIQLEETKTRWDFADSAYAQGISEDFPIDLSTHTIYGAAAAAADLLVQEYGRSFHLPTCCLRGPALTNPLQGTGLAYDLLSQLVHANLADLECSIGGHGIKQVREAIHVSDVVHFIELFCAQPRPAEVYNLGGGRNNTYSPLEISQLIEQQTGRSMRLVQENSIPLGEHLCYYSDLRKIQRHYPSWKITRTLPQIIEELISIGLQALE